MKKKILIGFGAFIILILTALISIPFLFKGKIQEMVLKTVNDNLDATVAFEDVNLSLLKSFPYANVSISKLSIINKAPFAGDTLIYFDEIRLEMSVKELLKDQKEGMNIRGVDTKNGIVNIIFNKDGIGNFDIALKDDTEKEVEKSEPFILKLQKYTVENLKFSFIDKASNIVFVLDKIYHSGKGDLSGDLLDLDTESSAEVSFDMDNTNFMNKIPVQLTAIIGMDMKNTKFTFKDNKALINNVLPLAFNGSIQMKETSQEYDLTFKTSSPDFNNFLALIPSAYSGSMSDIKTTGDFSVSGFAKGSLAETTIPTFAIEMASKNASFKFPDLPKSVQNIVIDTKIKNETGLLKDTYVDINELSFRIDQDIFKTKALIKNITENALVDANLKGIINLGNLNQAYPVKLEKKLSGILQADVTTKFDMKSVETSQYQKIDNSGTISLTGFNYAGPELAKPMSIKKTSLIFNPNHVKLQEFDAVSGSSDINITGTLDNFYGFMFKNQILKGNFNLTSNQLLVSDFMAPTPVETTKKETSTTATTPSEAVKIPAFLDCTFTAKANMVVYDNIRMKDVSGKMIIKDEKVRLENLKSSLFGGLIAMNGTISTQKDIPTFDMDLDLKNLDITESFSQLEFLNSVAPFAKTIVGKFNSKIALAGNLDRIEMTPDLNSLSGDLLGQLLDTKIKKENSKVLTTLDNSNLPFIDIDKINLKDVKGNFYFKDGKVNLRPTDLKYEGTKITLSGSHGFDQNMAYDLVFDVPAKYLGAEVTKVLNSLNIKNAENTLVPVNAKITGTFNNPKFNTDLKQSITNFTTQLIKDNKKQLIATGVKKAAELSGIKGAEKITNNIPTSKEEVKEKVNQEIEVAKEKATEKAKEEVKNKAGNALKGLFGK